jgi:GWxTD domain-containing protein
VEIHEGFFQFQSKGGITMRQTKRLLFLVSFFVLSNAISGFAQNPSEKPINQKRETNINRAFEIWLDEDVSLIITKSEKEAFLRLKTNEERENFIDWFWRKRDPNPDTEENEFREAYYERISYANEKFASGIPGWKTDRGKIYIIHGKPDSIESHPSGGSYERPSYEGGGSTTTYPFEIWFYRHLDNVGDGIEFEFVDPTGTGEYRMARNANEKDALLMVPGAGLTLGEQLFGQNKADRITGQSNNYQRTQDSPFERLRIETAAFAAPTPKDKSLEEITQIGGPNFLNENLIDFDMRVDYFRLSDEKVFVAFTIQADNKELTFKDRGGLQTAQMNIFGRVSAVSGKRIDTFEDSVSTNATAQELAEAKERKSIYQKAVALTPGTTYKVSVAIRDIDSGKIGQKNIGFTVPKYEPEKLGTSTLILASRLYQTTEKDIGGRFVIGDKKVIPNLSGNYKRGQEVGIYLQVYNAGIDQMTLKPAVDVDYILIKEGKEIDRQTEDWKGLSDSGQRLVLSRFIQTEKLAVGDYELKIKIHDRVNSQTLEPTAKFKVSE